MASKESMRFLIPKLHITLRIAQLSYITSICEWSFFELLINHNVFLLKLKRFKLKTKEER